MNSTLYQLCLWGFYLLPPVVLCVKFVQPKIPWWVILPLIILLGWALVVGRVEFYYAMLFDEIQAYESQGLQAPEQLLETWAADGAKRVFSLMFGWLVTALYLLPWYLLYFLLQKTRQHKQLKKFR